MLLSNKHYHRGGRFTTHSYKKSKVEWCGTSPADAFRPNSSGTSSQLNARGKLWKICSTQQEKVAKYFNSSEIKAMAQITHFYLLPPSLAALCCIGLTTFLEAKEHSRANKGLIETYNHDFIQSPKNYISSEVEGEVLQKLARVCAKVIDNRILIELLRHQVNINFVEMYRAISCSLIEPRSILSLEQGLNLNIIYGDLIRLWATDGGAMQAFWQDLRDFNQPYIDSFKQIEDRHYLSAGTEWLHKLTSKIAQYIRTFSPKEEDTETNKKGQVLICPGPVRQINPNEAPNGDISISNNDVDLPGDYPQVFLGLSYEDSRNVVDQIDDETKEAMKELANNVNQALNDDDGFGQKPQHVLGDAVEKDPWERTPIEGIPSEGSNVELDFGGHQMQNIVHEQAIPISHNMSSIEQLKAKSTPIAKHLSRMLYVSSSVQTRMVQGGSGANIDPSALPTYQVSEILYCKTEEYQDLDKTGQSIVVLAGDTSSSNSRDQIECQKILSAAWIAASKTKKNRIEFLGATYDSGVTSGGHHGPMVRWIYNDRFNEARTFEHAIARVDSIRATGGNSDIASWARIMNEIQRMMLDKPRLKRAHIYLIIISDCAFNKSFSSTPLSAAEEVKGYIKDLKEKSLKGRLHLTLVNLGTSTQTALDRYADLKLNMSSRDMEDPSDAAQKISAFVSKAIKQQRAKILPS